MARTSPRRSDEVKAPVALGPEDHHLYEPSADHHIFPDRVVVDIEQARTPVSENAKAIFALRKGDRLVESIRRSKGGSGTLFDINPYDLYLKEGFNNRNFKTLARRKAIASLGVSIGKVGVREPMVAHIGEDDKVYVHSGWNRLFATYYAIEIEGKPIKSVQVRFGKGGENDAQRNISQIVNNGSDKLQPIELAVTIKQQIDFGWTMEDIASTIGQSKTNVEALLKLMELPQSIRTVVEDGTISKHFAYKALEEAEGKEEGALVIIRSAIARARAEDPEARVLPMHRDGAERKVRTPRGGGGRRRTTEALPAPSSPAIGAIPKLVEVFRKAEKLMMPDGMVAYIVSDEESETIDVLIGREENAEAA